MYRFTRDMKVDKQAARRLVYSVAGYPNQDVATRGVSAHILVNTHSMAHYWLEYPLPRDREAGYRPTRDMNQRR